MAWPGTKAMAPKRTAKQLQNVVRAPSIVAVMRTLPQLMRSGKRSSTTNLWDSNTHPAASTQTPAPRCHESRCAAAVKGGAGIRLVTELFANTW